jgi:hypothetical protein
MHPLRRTALACIILWAGTGPGRAADVPSPEAHLGFRPGADFHLASWPQVVEYFRKLDAASDRVVVRELGKTTEGRPFIVAAISAPGTLADQAKYQDLQRRLADPRIKAPDDADPVAASKPVVVITCSIHSTETASTHMAMELAYDLATKDDRATREVLDSTILLLVPSVNPDGVDIVASWYERTKGHPWEGGGLPRLYHKYAGHDTNRDWFMLNLKETQLLSRLLYFEWFPTILYDVHQMGPRGARLFVPPFYDPINPNLDARVNQGIFLIGAHMATDLAAEGKRGVLTNAMYDNWWNGGNRTTPQRHNIVGVLTEAASVRMASPIFLSKDDLRGGSRGFKDHAPAVNFVDPWPGGWWRLRDVVDYELICARSVLTLAARYKAMFQSNLRQMGRDAVARGEHEPPFAWIVPRDQRDPGTAAEMVRILHDTGIEVRAATSPFEADGTSYPAGTWILPAAQPFRAHLKDMMERQAYPSRFTAGGQAEAPYDVAGWTLPLQMGVRAVAVDRHFEAVSEPIDRVEPTRGRVDGPRDAPYFTIANRANDDFIVLNELLAAGVEVRAASGPQRDEQGVLWFPANAESRAVLQRVLPAVSSRVVARTAPEGGRDAVPNPLWSRSRPPRIGVYQPWDPNMDEGWTRLVLEKFRFRYATLHNAEVRAGDLKARFDTILIPSISPRVLRTGYAANETEPAYVGGLGPEGAAALRSFVQEGGALVCLEDSCRYAIEELNLPVGDVLKGLKTSEFYAPGSILRAVEVRSSPADLTPSLLTLGMPAQFSVYFDDSLAFDAPVAAKGVVPGAPQFQAAAAVRYAGENVLESGWLLGPEKIQGKAALVKLSQGTGRVILFGFPPQHRAQPHGTFRLLFNALLMGGADRSVE